MAADRSGSLSGLTEQEAREFHGIFMASFIGFVVVAIIALLTFKPSFGFLGNAALFALMLFFWPVTALVILIHQWEKM